MSKSPGHRKWPDHEVREEPVEEKLQVEVDGEIVAESSAALRVIEDGSPPRDYFPRSDVHLDKLEPSQTTTRCPFKGTARYFTLRLDGKRVPDAAWSYEEPYDEHRALAGRVAFDAEKIPELEIRRVR